MILFGSSSPRQRIRIVSSSQRPESGTPISKSVPPRRARRRPSEDVGVTVGDGDDRVVERAHNVHDAVRHVAAGLAFLALGHGLLSRYPNYLKSLTPFLPATVLRGPLRVRALVRVR